MRISRISKLLAALVVGLASTAAIVSAASADAGQIRFKADAQIIGAALGQTSSTFEYTRKGAIKSVAIHTEGEAVVAGGMNADCRPKRNTACDALDGAFLMDIHSSDELLKQVEIVPNPFAPGLLDALSGKLSGDLIGGLCLSDSFDPVYGCIPVALGLGGTVQMKIHGTATIGCFDNVTHLPTLLLACQAGAGFLEPIVFDVTDRGTFEITGGYLGDIPIESGSGHVVAAFSGDLTTGTVGGAVTIRNGVLTPAN